MWSVLTSIAILASTTLATPEILERNLAYRSPYISHPALAIDTHAVHKRHLEANAQAHSEVTLRKRQEQVPRPAGEPVEYPSYPPGYGIGVTKYTNAQYVYGGELNYTHSVASGMSLLRYTRQGKLMSR
jgi:alkaline phosphatase D